MGKPGPEGLIPLPYYPWISRPQTVPLDEDESATALFLSGGDIDRAAALLKVAPSILKRSIRRSSRLFRLCEDLRAP
jgi:hypothetical protein